MSSLKHILESSERKFGIFPLSSLRFWILVRIVIRIIQPGVKKNLWMRKWWCKKIEAKIARNKFEMKATANEMDMATMRMAKKMLDLY